MATIIVSFDTEQEAQAAINRLSESHLGHVQARLLDSAAHTGYPYDETNTPMVTPNGTIDVRPSDNPDMPDTRDERVRRDASGSIPTTGSGQGGWQVMIETDEENEAEVRKIIRQS